MFSVEEWWAGENLSWLIGTKHPNKNLGCSWVWWCTEGLHCLAVESGWSIWGREVKGALDVLSLCQAPPDLERGLCMASDFKAHTGLWVIGSALALSGQRAPPGPLTLSWQRALPASLSACFPQDPRNTEQFKWPAWPLWSETKFMLNFLTLL